jgi:hypothetical protein
MHAARQSLAAACRFHVAKSDFVWGAQVQRVLDAGAVILGKANMGEFALSPDESVGSLFGVVRNPYDLDHTTSGARAPAWCSMFRPSGVQRWGAMAGRPWRNHACTGRLRDRRMQ